MNGQPYDRLNRLLHSNGEKAPVPPWLHVTPSASAAEPEKSKELDDDFDPIMDKKVLDHVRDILKCGVCLHYMTDPVSTNCGHNFCKSCIIESQKRNINCPSCNQRIVLTLVNFGFKEMCRSMIQIKCNKERCDWIGPYEDLDKHNTECQYFEVPCKCGSRCIRMEIEEHRKSKCILRTVTCEKCQEEMQFVKMNEHLDTLCSMNTKSCDLCHEQFPVRELMYHKMVQCPEAETKCKCEFKTLRKNLKQHSETECPLRKAQCPKCELYMLFKDIPEHIELMCTKNLKPCTICGEEVTVALIDDHIHDDCLMVTVTCRYRYVGCDHISLRKDMQVHYLENRETHVDMLKNYFEEGWLMIRRPFYHKQKPIKTGREPVLQPPENAPLEERIKYLKYLNGSLVADKSKDAVLKIKDPVTSEMHEECLVDEFDLVKKFIPKSSQLPESYQSPLEEIE